METEKQKQWDGEKIVEAEKEQEKTMVVLIWDGKRGKHDKFLISPALQQHCEDELHFVIGMRLGEL